MMATPELSKLCIVCYGRDPTKAPEDHLIPAGKCKCATCGSGFCDDCAKCQGLTEEGDQECTLCDNNTVLVHFIPPERLMCKPVTDPAKADSPLLLVCTDHKCSAEVELCDLAVWASNEQGLTDACSHAVKHHPGMKMCLACEEDPKALKPSTRFLTIKHNDVELIAKAAVGDLTAGAGHALASALVKGAPKEGRCMTKKATEAIRKARQALKKLLRTHDSGSGPTDAVGGGGAVPSAAAAGTVTEQDVETELPMRGTGSGPTEAVSGGGDVPGAVTAEPVTEQDVETELPTHGSGSGPTEAVSGGGGVPGAVTAEPVTEQDVGTDLPTHGSGSGPTEAVSGGGGVPGAAAAGPVTEQDVVAYLRETAPVLRSEFGKYFGLQTPESWKAIKDLRIVKQWEIPPGSGKVFVLLGDQGHLLETLGDA